MEKKLTYLLFYLVLTSTTTAFAQKVRVVQPEQTLMMQSDTLYWEIPELKIADFSLFSKMESPYIINNDVQQGQPFTFILKNGKNVVRCPSTDEVKTVYPVTLKKGSQVKQYQVIFWIGQRINFDEHYIQANQGKATTEVPEVFELANVVFALTRKGLSDSNMVEMNSDYYREVMQHFKTFENHPLLVKLNQLLEEDPNTYLNYRMDSYCYTLQENELVSSPQYKHLGYRQHLSDDASLWESFVKETSFRSFYQNHTPYYQQLIQEANQLLAIKRMWQWLEQRFPARYDSYKIVISPLINGTHNTERFENNNFSECLMFVRDAGRYDKKKYTNSVVSGLYSGIVFTEIDHNYVNPVSDTFKSRLEPIFKDRNKWTSEQGDAKHYQSAYAVFNEYMTHSVYLIYIKDYYPPAEYEIIKENRTSLMNRRGFKRFASFHQALLQLYQQQEKKDFEVLYPSILKWSSTQ